MLLLLIITVFFSISAPDETWAWLTTAVVLAVTLSIAMLASGAQAIVMRAWVGVGVLGIGASIIIAVTQAGSTRGYLALTTLLLTLVTMGAIARRLWLHVSINVLTVLGPCASTCY